MRREPPPQELSMKLPYTKSKSFAASLARAVVAFALAGIGAAAFAATFDLSPEQPGRVRGARDDAVIRALPASFKFVEPDTLTVGIAPSQPPISAYATDARTVVGFDADLAQLLADSLGRKLKIVALAWPDWPLALESGRVDAVLSNVTVTEERKAKFDFSTYRKDQVGFYVKSDSKIASIRQPRDVAGLRVITDAGTNQEKILLEWDRENVAHGLKPVTVQYYDDHAVKSVALQAGRADAIFSVNSVLAYQAAQQHRTKLVGAVSGGWPRTADIAVTTRRGSGLAAPVTLAINGFIRNGTYRRVLERWSLGSEAIDASRTNPPGLPKT
ncbi:transporter substrate-binding domain-containing protein [Burkholderia pseudomallei]|uniref:ABC transporter substrate-binding protein n=1 Tax=Burkholderia pseudomallei TaxID=28450 RepID=UPI00014F8F00|nr:ABC transporter substrate-binding protein [Burkholderia pseudomallei]APZ21345.1 ABC transporter substrate-binding protein [Burkholderia pseudomallei]APZ27545.1 ABC transporter substrate-binding protein [Burkholderia pseudomallei]EBA50100.1 ABC transporter, substrate binding protein [Burkholderia pseudomallei 305]MBM5619548.1 transporter substrate-binding domain-containing protein [Burkholderia pseudomallei]MBM5628383.1 transporter substrate-binding domain-containing protein [Burkholderia ps